MISFQNSPRKILTMFTSSVLGFKKQAEFSESWILILPNSHKECLFWHLFSQRPPVEKSWHLLYPFSLQENSTNYHIDYSTVKHRSMEMLLNGYFKVLCILVAKNLLLMFNSCYWQLFYSNISWRNIEEILKKCFKMPAYIPSTSEKRWNKHTKPLSLA